MDEIICKVRQSSGYEFQLLSAADCLRLSPSWYFSNKAERVQHTFSLLPFIEELERSSCLSLTFLPVFKSSTLN